MNTLHCTRKPWLHAVPVLLAAMLAACGSSNDSTSSSTTAVINSRVVVGADASNGVAIIQSVLNQAIVFPAGVPAFGTAVGTTLTFFDSSPSPSFSIKTDDGLRADGKLVFGSCNFKITTSTFSTGSPIAAGQSVFLNSSVCQFGYETCGLAADGQPHNVRTRMVLGVAGELFKSCQVPLASLADAGTAGPALEKPLAGGATPGISENVNTILECDLSVGGTTTCNSDFGGKIGTATTTTITGGS